MKVGLRRYLPEIAFGSCATLVSLALLHDSSGLPERSALFPHAVLVCMTVAGLGILGEGLFNAAKSEGAPRAAARSWLSGIVVPAVVLFGSGLLLYLLGFYLTAPIVTLVIYIVHVQLATGGGFAADTLMRGGVLAIAMAAAMYLVFNIIIGLPSPNGALI